MRRNLARLPVVKIGGTGCRLASLRPAQTDDPTKPDVIARAHGFP